MLTAPCSFFADRSRVETQPSRPSESSWSAGDCLPMTSFFGIKIDWGDCWIQFIIGFIGFFWEQLSNYWMIGCFGNSNLIHIEQRRFRL